MDFPPPTTETQLQNPSPEQLTKLEGVLLYYHNALNQLLSIWNDEVDVREEPPHEKKSRFRRILKREVKAGKQQLVEFHAHDRISGAETVAREISALDEALENNSLTPEQIKTLMTSLAERKQTVAETREKLIARAA